MKKSFMLKTDEVKNGMPFGGIKKYIFPAAVTALSAAVIFAAGFSSGEESIIAGEDSAQTDIIPQQTTAQTEITEQTEQTEQTQQTTAASQAETEAEASAEETEELTETAAQSEEESETKTEIPERSFKAAKIEITVKADGETSEIELEKGDTAADALDMAGIELGEDDRVNMDLDDVPEEGDIIRVQRVEFVRRSYTETLDYQTVYIDDDTLLEGREIVLTEGVEGEAQIEVVDRVVDGDVEATEELDREIVTETVNEVIRVGTKAPAEVPEGCTDPNAVDHISAFDIPEWLMLDENGIPTEYVTTHYGRSCAYTADPGALMSTGKPVFQGYVAVDPNLIPYGSELYIVADDGEVYGYAIAADTGYSVRAGHIIVDLFMDEYDDCIQWGSKNVTIYVLK